MHRLAYRIVASEGEGHVTQAAADEGVREGFFDLTSGFKKGPRVVVVLRDPGSDGQYIRVENDVLRGESNDLGQNSVRALTDSEFAFSGVRLPLLIKGHYNDRCAVTADLTRLRDKLFFAFLKADGVDHALPLQAAQAGFEHLPV